MLGDDAELILIKERNEIWIRANADKVREAREYLNRFQETFYQSNDVYAFKLKNADAAETVAVMKAFVAIMTFLGDERPVYISSGGSTVIVSGNPRKMAEIVAILPHLDVKPK